MRISSSGQEQNVTIKPKQADQILNDMSNIEALISSSHVLEINQEETVDDEQHIQKR